MPRVAGDDAAGAPCGPVHEASRTRTARPESRTQNLGPCWARRAAPASRRDSLRRNAGELRAAVSAAGVLSEPCCPTMPYMIYCLIPCRMRRRLGFSRGLAFHVWGWARPAAARLGARHYPWPTHAHLSRASRCERGTLCARARRCERRPGAIGTRTSPIRLCQGVRVPAPGLAAP